MVVYFGVSGLRVKESPGHGPDLVEEAQCFIRTVSADCSGVDKKAKVAVDLLGDSPVVKPIPSGPPVAFCQVCWYGRRRSDHLIGKAFERSRYPPDE